MDIKSTFEFVTQFLSNYIFVFFSVLLSPEDLHDNVWTEYVQIEETDKKTLVLGREKKLYKIHTRQKLNSNVLGFVVISIIFGSILQSLVPNRPSAPAIFNIVTVVMIVWLLYAGIVHTISKLLGGAASLTETIAVTFLVLSVAYVTASLASLIVSIFNTRLSNLYYLVYVVLIEYLLLMSLIPVNSTILSKAKRVAWGFLIAIISILFFVVFGSVFSQTSNIILTPPTTATPIHVLTRQPTNTATLMPPTPSPTNTATLTPSPTLTATLTVTPTLTITIVQSAVATIVPTSTVVLTEPISTP